MKKIFFTKFAISILYCYICRKYYAFMNEFDIELAKVVDAAVQSSIDIDNVSSLKDLYDEKVKHLRISNRQVLKILGMDRNTLNPILNGEAKQVNFINIVKLSHFLSISVNDLMKIYLPKLNREQIGEIQRSREAGYIFENFDVAVLTKQKFFNPNMTSKEMSDKIKSFFSIDSLYSYSENASYPVFSRTKRSSNDIMRDFWVKSALTQFEAIDNPNAYDRKALLNLIPKIRPYTRDVKLGLVKVVKALYNVGITVIYQPSLEKIQVRGATMVVNNKPCIVLSDLQKQYPTLWFTLLHELHHVLFDFDDIAQRTYHISSKEGDLFLMDEEKADDFAREYLLNESRLKFISGYINSKYNVEKHAKLWGLHSSIIYAIYCFQTNEWALYSKYIPKMNDALRMLNTHPFECDTLVDAAKELKELIYN